MKKLVLTSALALFALGAVTAPVVQAQYYVDYATLYVDNWTPYVLYVYIDGYYAGSVSDWGENSFYVYPGYTRVVVRSYYHHIYRSTTRLMGDGTYWTWKIE